jgi:hypothetical protein
VGSAQLFGSYLGRSLSSIEIRKKLEENVSEDIDKQLFSQIL